MKKLNQAEKQYIKDNYEKIQARVIADKLGITASGVHIFAKRNFLHKSVRYYHTGRNWTDEEVYFLIKNYKDLSVSDFMARFNRSKWAICSKKLELKKKGLLE